MLWMSLVMALMLLAVVVLVAEIDHRCQNVQSHFFKLQRRVTMQHAVGML
jgi:hypothetical protein